MFKSIFKSIFKSVYKVIDKIGESLQSPLLLLIRLYWGYQFSIAGYGKLLNLENVSQFFESLNIPLPYLNAIFAGGIEMIGGALLFLGLLSRLAAIPLLGVTCVVYYTAGHEAIAALVSQFDPKPFFNASIFLFGYATFLVFCFGPGKISLDYWLAKRVHQNH